MNYLRASKQSSNPAQEKRARGVAVFLVLSTVLFFTVPYFTTVLHRYEAHVADAWHGTSQLSEDFFENTRNVRARNNVLQQSQDILNLNEDYTTQIVVAANRCSGCVHGRITRHPQKYIYSSYAISVGSNDGVALGDIVLIDGLYALGEVREVGPQYAYVVPIMDNGNTHHVFHRETQTKYEMIGKGNGVAEIHIPREIAISEGQWLYHATMDDVVMGYVEYINFDDRDPFQTILVRTPFRESQVRIVAVVTDAARNAEPQNTSGPQSSVELIEIVETSPSTDEAEEGGGVDVLEGAGQNTLDTTQ